MEYRGIQLDESVKFYNKNKKRYGEFSLSIKSVLDKLADKLAENGHILLSKYKSNSIEILIDFKCEHAPQPITPSSYEKRKTKNCPICAKKEKSERNQLKNKERSQEAKERFFNLLKENGHEAKSPYISAIKKLLIDFKCGHPPHPVKPNNYSARDSRCPKCDGQCPEQSKEEFFKKIKKNNHEVLSDWLGNRKEILIDFKCEHLPQWIEPTNYKVRERCPECGHIQRHVTNNNNSRKRFLALLQINGHIAKSEYIKALEKMLIDFACGHEPHWIRPNDYKNGYGCPKCDQSKGEKILYEWLKENQINHYTQYKLPNRNWEYDFFIPSKNLIVEVQGRQHFEFVKYFHVTIEGFLKEQENDYNKREYAKKFGYDYLEIDYREGKPQLVLKRFLKTFKPKNKKRSVEMMQLSLF